MTTGPAPITGKNWQNHVEPRIMAEDLRALEQGIKQALDGGGGTSSGIELVSGTVTLGSSGAPIREFYCTGAATIGGVSFPAGTAVVWRRTTAGQWGYIVVDGWTAAGSIPDPDPELIPVTATAPNWADDTLNGGGYWSTPTITGVTYSPASGTASPGQTVTVTATAQTGYQLTGTTSWVHEFPAAPTLPPTTNLADAITALNPAGYWKLDETTGTTATDSSGNGHHGTYNGAHTLAGRDGAAVFNGGYVEVPDNDDWSIAGATNGFTVFALAYTGAILSVRQHIIAKGESGKYEWGVDVKESAKSGTLEASAMMPAGNPMMSATTTAAQPVAAWSAICASFPAYAYKANPAIYRDSDTPQAFTEPNWQPEVAIANGTAPLRIAGRGDNVGPWKGALRHVAIFRTQLSAAQVKTLMDAARADGLIP